MSGLIENPTSVDWSGMRWTPNGFRLLVPALPENPKPATTLSSEHEVANSISLLSFDASPYEPFLVEWTDQLGDIRIQRLSRDPFGNAGIILSQTDASGRIKMEYWGKTDSGFRSGTPNWKPMIDWSGLCRDDVVHRDTRCACPHVGRQSCQITIRLRHTTVYQAARFDAGFELRGLVEMGM